MEQYWLPVLADGSRARALLQIQQDFTILNQLWNPAQDCQETVCKATQLRHISWLWSLQIIGSIYQVSYLHEETCHFYSTF